MQSITHIAEGILQGPYSRLNRVKLLFLEALAEKQGLVVFNIRKMIKKRMLLPTRRRILPLLMVMVMMRMVVMMMKMMMLVLG